MTVALLAIVTAAVFWQRSRSAPPPLWSGTALGGSSIASHARISPDGQLLAFRAIIDGLSQVAVMKPDSSSWTALTHDRTKRRRRAGRRAGPYRMLIDTGNASSIVRPVIARRLNLKAAYAVEQASVTGVHRFPVAILDEVRAGSVSDRSVEAMIGDVFQAGVDGVLGQSWLVRHDYLLDYRNRRIALDVPAAGSGIQVPLRSYDGCPVVAASIDGRARELVVDSGWSALGNRPLTAFREQWGRPIM
jgi:hypothetical protein